jgi:hypothetical protein
MGLAAPGHVQFAAGDFVRVRGSRWIVEDATTFPDCVVLTLLAASHADNRPSCKLLLPFDRPVTSSGISTVRAVTRRRWIRHLHAQLSELRMSGRLRGVAGTTIDILPFQLEPALALIRGHASRFLLADEVGLGKTIQAALMLSELQQRGWCERALILTPSGLRRQWADELDVHFGIRAVVIDADQLSDLTGSLPLDVNPWAVHPVVITSMDFVKQPEVLRGVCRQLWDMLIVDEAHHAASGSLRYEAVRVLAARSRHVVLLTATPHAGDESAYRALCDIGQVDRSDPIVLFRRTRLQAGGARTRRVHLLPVTLSADELAMHRLRAVANRAKDRQARSAADRDCSEQTRVLRCRLAGPFRRPPSRWDCRYRTRRFSVDSAV